MNDVIYDNFAKRRKSKFPQPHMWKKNINMRARNSDQKYTNSTGVEVPARKMKTVGADVAINVSPQSWKT